MRSWFSDGGIDEAQWDCGFCKENKLDAARNCDGKGEPALIKVYDDVMDRCPVASLDRDACETLGVWEQCEGGFGSGYLPSVLLEETQYALNVRRIVSQEKYKIEQKKEKHGRQH